MSFRISPNFFSSMSGFIINLPQLYKNNNQNRNNNTKFIQYLLDLIESSDLNDHSGKKNIMLLAGFEAIRLTIEAEYSYRSPAGNSRYYDLLTKHVGYNEQNCFSAQERLILLSDLYHTLLAYQSKPMLLSDNVATPAEALEFTARSLRLWQKVYDFDMDKILHAYPNHQALDESIKNLNNKYAEIVSKRWLSNNKQREELIKFLQIVNDNLVALQFHSVDEITIKNFKLQQCRLGLLLFAYKYINSSGSDLADLCSAALNKSVDSIELQQQSDWLNALIALFSDIKLHNYAAARLNNFNEYDAALKRIHAEVTEKLHQPNLGEKCVHGAVAVGVSSGIKLAGGQFFRRAAVTALGTVATSAPVGFIIVAGGALITKYVGEKIIPSAINSAYQSSIDWLGHKIAGLTVKPIVYVVSSSTDSVKRALGFATDKCELIEFSTISNILLKLPDTIVAESVKDKLYQLTGRSLDEEQFEIMQLLKQDEVTEKKTFTC